MHVPSARPLAGSPRAPRPGAGSGKKLGSSRKGKLGLLQSTIGNRRADLKYPVSPCGRPAHLTFFVHAGIDEAVGGGFGRGTRDRVIRPISLAVVDQGGFVLDQVGLKIADQFEEALELVAGIRQPSILSNWQSISLTALVASLT